MSAAIYFVVPGDPHGKGRPKASSRGGFVRMYTPAPTRLYEAEIARLGEIARGDWPVLATPISLRVIAHHDVPRQPHVVDEHDVPPDGAVVSDMHSDHQGRVVSDSSAAALPTDVNRHVFTNDDVRADFEATRLRVRRNGLRGAAYDRKRVYFGALPERRVAFDDDVTMKPNSRAKSSAWADGAPGSDDAIRREERALRDD